MGGAQLGLTALASGLAAEASRSTVAIAAFHAEKGLIDKYEVYLNPLVWGEGSVQVLGDRGTIRLEFADVKQFDSSGPTAR